MTCAFLGFAAIPFGDTIHLFGWLIFSYFRTALEDPSLEQSEEFANDEKIRSLMREELGMFNHEQSSVQKALEIIPYLGRWEDFKRRGPRRQFALLKNEGFVLALQMAAVDYIFGAEVIHFWRQAFVDAREQLAELGEERSARIRPNRPNRRRRNDRRPRPPQNTPDPVDQT